MRILKRGGEVSKKLFAFIMALAMAFMMGGATVSAVSLTSGQTHYYTVQFRDDNRAIVYAKLAFQNDSSDNERTTYSFKLPEGIEITNLSVQQILAKTERKCLAYATGTYYRTDDDCIEFDEPITYDEDFDYSGTTTSYGWYYDYYYYNYRYADHFDYVDLDASQSGDTYTVTLDQPVKSHKQGAILVSYISDSFVNSQWFGRFNYDFKTFRVDEVIDRASVAINFDGGMYSREALQDRTYDSSTTNDAVAEGADSSYSSGSIDKIISSVGQGGVYTKTQTSMLPDDVMHVSGLYATSRLALYTNEIEIAIIVLLILGLVIWQGPKFWRRKRPKAKRELLKSTKLEVGQKSAEVNLKAQSQIGFGKMLAVSGISIISSIVAVVAVFLLPVMISSGYYYALSSVMQIIVVIVLVFALAITLLIAPLLYMYKYGRRGAFKWILVHLGVVVALSLLVTFIVFILLPNPSIYYPYY